LVEVDELHAAFLKESRTRGRWKVSRTGNPGRARFWLEWGTHPLPGNLHRTACVTDLVGVMRVIATSPEQAVELLDRAFAQGDLETVLSFYEEAAIVVTEPGKRARGAAELRSFFARAVQSGISAKQLTTQVIEAEGVALFLSRWTLQQKDGAAERTFIATTVFRKQRDGGWKALIDNPFGPLILGPE
jgi:ketosteroid isomerase-like protein